MNPIPVIVLTGFLGSGKTTILNRILAENHAKKIGVIENEFGEIGIDNDLVVGAEEEILEMNNGCLCCTVRGDLIRILQRLSQRTPRLDLVVVESTGLADPGPIAQTFFVDPEIVQNYRFQGFVTLVDAFHFLDQLDEHTEVAEQVAYSDLILLNKVDLVDSERVSRVRRAIENINSGAVVLSGRSQDFSVAEILALQGFNLEAALQRDRSFLELERSFEWAGRFRADSDSIDLTFRRGPDLTANLLWVEEDRIDADEAQALFDREEVVDLPIRDDRRVRILDLNADETRFTIETKAGSTYTAYFEHEAEEFELRATIGGATILPFEEKTFRGRHSHSEVQSVGIRSTKAFDASKLELWLSILLQMQGNEIFRSKGVFAIRGERRKLLFQGVRMLAGYGWGEPWGDGPKETRVVFIGKNLDREALKRGIEACVWTSVADQVEVS